MSMISDDSLRPQDQFNGMRVYTGGVIHVVSVDHIKETGSTGDTRALSDGGLSKIEGGALAIFRGVILWVGPQERRAAELREALEVWCQAHPTALADTSIDTIIEGAELIDCSGEHLCPGFIDAHVHLGLYPEGFVGEPKDLNELTHPLTPQLRALDGVWPGDIAFEKARAGGVTTVCVLPGSANVIGGVGVVMRTAGIDVEEMSLKEPACLKIAFGYNVKYNHGQKGKAPMTRMAIAAMMRARFEEALRYEERRLIDPTTPRDRGQEHVLMALRREIPVRAHASRSDDILTAVRIAKEFGLKLIIEHGYEAIQVIPQLLSVGASVVYGPAFRTCGHSEDLHFDFGHAQILLEAGIPVAQMTDHPIVPVQYLSIQAGLCVRAGLDADEALALITAYPAMLLGCADRVGRLKAGLDADFLRMSGPPLDISARVLTTYQRGTAVYSA
jgi:imidazolonepropionase-like amidohydrolase